MDENKNLFYATAVVDLDEALRRLRHWTVAAQHENTQERRQHAARMAEMVVRILENHATRVQIHFKEDAF